MSRVPAVQKVQLLTTTIFRFIYIQWYERRDGNSDKRTAGHEVVAAKGMRDVWRKVRLRGNRIVFSSSHGRKESRVDHSSRKPELVVQRVLLSRTPVRCSTTIRAIWYMLLAVE